MDCPCFLSTKALGVVLIPLILLGYCLFFLYESKLEEKIASFVNVMPLLVGFIVLSRQPFFK